jgi:hypothetical protein
MKTASRNANAFEGTFAFLQHTKSTLKKSKEPASQRTNTPPQWAEITRPKKTTNR